MDEMENLEMDGANSSNEFKPKIDIAPIHEQLERVKAEFNQIIVGQDELIELFMIGLLCNGHVLLEGVPGIAKTLSAKVFARTLSSDFSRIQFTPDLMPMDIIGTSVFNLKESKFEFIKGPIFSNIILIDEINRSPAKTQAALFEVMEERQITFEGKRNVMKEPFFIIATQNPIEQEGTYRLPEGQLDRFLFKIKLTYPSKTDEIDILKRFRDDLGQVDLSSVKEVCGLKELNQIRDLIKQVHLEDDMLNYICEIVNQTRNHAKIYLGASPRASLALLKTSKMAAVLSGRDFVIPDDIQRMCPHVLNHRLILTPDAEMEELDPYDLIDEMIKNVEVPR